MTILNFLWGYSTGGIGKCFLTYARLGEVEPDLKVISVCVITAGHNWDLKSLYDQNIQVIKVKNKFDFLWMKKIKTIYDNNDIDFFFCHGHNGPVMLSLFSIRYGLKTPLICTSHGFNPKPSLLSKFYFILAASVLRNKRVKKIICVEKFTPDVLVQRGVKRKKIVTVYNGIEPFIYTSKLDLSQYCNKDYPIIITASRLTKIKGIDYLLKSLAFVKNQGYNFHYFCIGDGEELNALKDLCAKLELDEDVSFMGYQNNIPDWLATCDIFALPSLEEFHSIAILEAMRAKKAIVATLVGGNPESLRDEQDALMVPSCNSESLANALIRLISSVELRESLSVSAYNRFKELFTINAMMNNLAHEIITTSK